MRFIIATTRKTDKWPDSTCSVFFQSVLNQLKIPLNDVAYVVLDNPVESNQAKIKALPQGVPVLLLGEQTMRAVGIDEKITIVAGYSYWLAGRRLIPINQPADILTNPLLFMDFEQAIESILLHDPMECPVRSGTLLAEKTLSHTLSGPGKWFSECCMIVRNGVRRKLVGQDQADLLSMMDKLVNESDLWGDLKSTIEIKYIRNEADLLWLQKELLSDLSKFRCIDLETAGFNVITDKVLCAAIGLDEGRAALITEDCYNSPELQSTIRTVLTQPGIKWILHNAKFDFRFLRNSIPGLNLQATGDTLLLHYCLDERLGTHGLKILARRKLGLPDYEDLVRTLLPSKSASFSWVPRKILYTYACYDVCFTLRLNQKLLSEKAYTPELDLLYDSLVDWQNALTEIEDIGIHVDMDAVSAAEEDFLTEQHELEQRLQRITNKADFNPRSFKQVQVHMYDVRGMPHVSLFRGDKPRSTSREAVMKLLERYPGDEFLTTLAHFRDIAKILSTYVRPIKAAVSHRGRLHSDFKLHGTVTGRISASKPNLLNIPRKTKNKYAERIRNFFIASPGYVLIGADYSQAELRVLATFSEEPFFKRVYDEGRDLHDEATTMIYGLQPPAKTADPVEKKVWKEARMIAKMLNFGLVYGRTAKSIAVERAIPVEEAQDIMDRYFANMPEAARWLKETRARAVRESVITTPLGRKRRFGLVTDDIKWRVENQATNAPIQGTASDICMQAFVNMHRWLKKTGKGRALLMVHDFIMVEALEAHQEEVCRELENFMLEAGELILGDTKGIDYKAEAEVAMKWGDL